MTAPNLQPTPVRRLPLSAVLQKLSEELGRTCVSVRDLFAVLGDRALAALLFIERAEKLLRPRLSGLALPPIEHALGFICLLLAVILVLPIPLGNNPPAFAIALIALGVLERDGLWVLAGVCVTALSLTVVSGILLAIFNAATVLASTALQ